MMELDVLPLAEVHLKVDDVAINFDYDEEKQGICGSKPLDETNGCENDSEEETLNFIKNEITDYEEIDVHFLSNQGKADPSESDRRFQCQDCGRYFVRNEHLKNHRRTHTGERPYTCDQCQRPFAKHFDLTRHKQYVHGSLSTFFICEMCGKTFSRKDHLKTHIVTHKNKAFQKDVKTLRTYTCYACGRSYCRLDNLKKHLEKHAGDADFDPEEEFKDPRAKDINVHFMTANDAFSEENSCMRVFACEYCGRLFARKDHLKNHERTHTGERPFQCDYCDKRFTKRFVMTRHLQNIHRIENKTHECTVCNKKFSRRDYLKNHERTHTGERPFQCDYCDKRFAKRFVMTRHLENVHRIENKTHECTECDKRFTRKDCLKTHMKIHILTSLQIKEKIHTCEICQKEFTRRDNLKTHMKIHFLAAMRRSQEENDAEQNAIGLMKIQEGKNPGTNNEDNLSHVEEENGRENKKKKKEKS